MPWVPNDLKETGGGEKRRAFLRSLGAGGETLTTAFKQRGRKKERKTPENRGNKRKPKNEKTSGSGSRSRDIFFPLRGAH